jgi:anti-sigma factor RsiW
MHDARISEIDLMAYLDGQLDDRRRLDVETALSVDPPAAAGLMSDFARRTALRLALSEPAVAPSAALEDRLSALGRRAGRGRVILGLAAALSAMALVGLAAVGVPRFAAAAGSAAVVEDALQSREATLVRTRMDSQVETPRLAVGEIRSAVSIRLPTLPVGWTVLDVQVFPSDGGPSVQLLIDTGRAGPVFLFASRQEGGDSDAPVLIRRAGETIALWEVQGQSFALMGAAPRESLRAMAIDLADNRLL